jgi:hypothetical protein
MNVYIPARKSPATLRLFVKFMWARTVVTVVGCGPASLPAITPHKIRFV